MKELLEAIQIFLKYGDEKYPTHCEHDVLTVHGYDPRVMTKADLIRLNELGFLITGFSSENDTDAEDWERELADEDGLYFQSYKYGSC